MLAVLGKKYGTDKVDPNHTFRGKSYMDVYERYFFDIRYQVKVVVEIGVLGGASLKVWEEYFPHAMIYGIDINDDCKNYEKGRIRIRIGSQDDEAFLRSLKNEVGNIDVLIDDGSHITSHQIVTHRVLFPITNRFYVIEDLRNSYEEILNHHDIRKIWSGMHLNKKEDPLKNYREDFDNFLKKEIKEMDFHRAERLVAIHCHPMMVFFEIQT